MEELPGLVHAAFPIEPMPERYWLDGVELLNDIPQELANRIAYRPWIEVTMLAWTMTGAHAVTARNYFAPDAFRYYLPSLLIGGLNDFRYIDLASGMPFASGQETPNNGRVVASIFRRFFS